nr:RNA-directed DNA polymerase, eukaryota [Tanacetum cinerariifolium]
MAGAVVGDTKLNISHLFYADDVVFLTDWSHGEVDGILDVLHNFYVASGLKINISKSNIYGIGVDVDEKTSLYGLGLTVLYMLETEKNCKVHDRWNDGGWVWKWRRDVRGGIEQSQLNSLLILLVNNGLQNGQDKARWTLDDQGIFSVAATRLHIDEMQLVGHDLVTRWCAFVPRKKQYHALVVKRVWKPFLMCFLHVALRKRFGQRSFDGVKFICKRSDHSQNGFHGVIRFQMLTIVEQGWKLSG